MKHETNWLWQRLDEFDTSVQHARWHADEVGQCRAELSPVWNDRCADEMSRRFLDPWAGEAAANLDALRVQIAELRESLHTLEHGDESAEQVVHLAREVHELISHLNGLLSALSGVLQEAFDCATVADTEVHEVRHLLAQAEAAGSAA